MRLSPGLWFTLGALLVLVLVMATACSSTGIYQMSDNWCAVHPYAEDNRCWGHYRLTAPKGESWAQDNLKEHDVADCKTANPVFVAPGGVLTQCTG